MRLIQAECIAIGSLNIRAKPLYWGKIYLHSITMNKIITSNSIISKHFVTFATEKTTTSLKMSIYRSSTVFINTVVL